MHGGAAYAPSRGEAPAKTPRPRRSTVSRIRNARLFLGDLAMRNTEAIASAIPRAPPAIAMGSEKCDCPEVVVCASPFVPVTVVVTTDDDELRNESTNGTNTAASPM